MHVDIESTHHMKAPTHIYIYIKPHMARTHSDIGLRLTQFPGKIAMEPKGERVGALEGVLTKELFT